MNKNKKWTRIADSKVRHIWECVCGNKAVVSPTFYAESGTPICLGSRQAWQPPPSARQRQGLEPAETPESQKNWGGCLTKAASPV